MKLEQYIADDLQIPLETIQEAVQHSRKKVKLIKIKKNDGSIRVAYNPAKKTKLIIYWIIQNILISMPVNKCATAYINGKSIKDNVLAHSCNNYYIRIDFKDFFPSICFNDFSSYLHNWHSEQKPAWELNKKSKTIINKTCFYKDNKLPIGYPSSPIISNIVMYKLDTAILNLLESKEKLWGKIVYTRYADDLIFSTNKKGICQKIESEISKLIKNWDSPNLTINNDKTRYMSASGGSAILTGLKVCHDGHITLHRKYKDKVRLLCSLLTKRKLDPKDTFKLIGHLSYIENIDPVFYSKIKTKYFMALSDLKP